MYRFAKRRAARVSRTAGAVGRSPARLEMLETRTLFCSIGDRVWLDADCNGIQDAGEAGAPGVVVHLYDSGGNELMTTTTDANGNYLFQRFPDGHVLDVGTFTVKFDIPAGYHASPANQGPSGGSGITAGSP